MVYIVNFKLPLESIILCKKLEKTFKNRILLYHHIQRLFNLTVYTATSSYHAHGKTIIITRLWGGDNH